jgi:hypothetical protein
MTRTKNTNKITATLMALGLALTCYGARIPRRPIINNRPTMAASK